MQPENSAPFVPLSPFALNGNLSTEGFQLSRVLFLGSVLFSQSVSGRFSSGDGDGGDGGVGGMDFSKVGEKILSSVRSARSLGLLPYNSDRPEVPARAAAAAAIARALAGIPPHQRHSLSSSSEELSSIYGSRPRGQIVEELEEEFYEEEFDPVRHVLEHLPSEENELTYLEEKAALRLAQLDKIAERLSRHVMEHHEEMVKGMQLVSELEKDLKVANVICMNGRRHLTSSRNEISRDLFVPTNSRRKQALLDMIPILTELRHAVDMQIALESHVDNGDFVKAFQVLSEYLQLLDSLSGLSAIQEMSHGVEVWLGKTLRKLDSLLLGVCQDFAGTGYITVVDAYALIGDVSGLAEKIQSFFMQEVLSETHSVLKNIVQEDQGTPDMLSTRLTYSDLCTRVPESKFRQCLLATLAVLFKLMCSYYAIMSFQSESQVSTCQVSPLSKKESDITGSSPAVQHVDSLARSLGNSKPDGGSAYESMGDLPPSSSMGETTIVAASLSDANGTNGFMSQDSCGSDERDGGAHASSSGSPWFQLQKDATTFVSQTLQRGRKNLWQLTTSRVSVLLSSSAVCSASIHQFLKNYEDLNIFILAGEAFCGFEAVEFRQKVKTICESYFMAFHRQNISALKMVMEKENWQTLPADLIQVVSFAGLVGDGAALIVPSDTSSNARMLHSHKSAESVKTGSRNSGFSDWLNSGNLFSLKLSSKESYDTLSPKSTVTNEHDGKINGTSHMSSATSNSDANHINGNTDLSEDENEDLHADFIDEDSQLPSRIAKPQHSRSHSSSWNGLEMRAQTGSSLCLLRLMDKYARLMQKLEIVNVEFFKGICELFGIFFYFVFENFGQQNPYPSGKGLNGALSYRLKTALSRITQDCDQWIKSPSVSFSSSSPGSLNIPFTHMDVTPTSPPSTNSSQAPSISFGLKERCAGAETLSLVARLLHRSKSHLQSMLLQNKATVVEDFYLHLVDSVPDLVEQIHRTTARSLLHINGYVDRIANAKWEVKELGMEHNGYVDLLLGEFKHYRTRLAHGGIDKEVQDLLLEYGVENLAETLIEGLSRVKRCTDEGRALMSLDLQVLINGLQHFVSINVKPKLQIVEAFIKAYYLPETEYVHWARGHPEYSKSQMVGLVNLVATMKSWKRKTRLEVIEKIESAG